MNLLRQKKKYPQSIDFAEKLKQKIINLFDSLSKENLFKERSKEFLQNRFK